MRDVKTIKDERELLRPRRNSYSTVIQKLITLGKSVGRTQRETHILRAAGEARRMLDVQINALTYALNEDTELTKIAEEGFYVDEYGIDHNVIMEVLD